MKIAQVFLVGLALTVIVLGLGLGIRKAYISSPLAQKTEDVQLVESIPRQNLTYMQSKDVASLLLVK